MSKTSKIATLLRSRRMSFALGFGQQLVIGKTALHDHPGFEIVYHPTGTGSSTLATGATLTFAAEDVIIYAPWQRHDQVQTAAGEDLCIQVGIDGPLPESLPAWFHLSVRDDAWMQRELRELSASPVAHNDLERVSLDHRAAAALARLLARATALEAGTVASPAEQHAANAHRYITENYRDIGRLEDVARQVGIGYGHLRHSFQRRYQRSLVRHLMEVRVERAKELLLHAPLAIAEISGQVGYATPRHFSAVFKAIAGTTPAEFRARR